MKRLFGCGFFLSLFFVSCTSNLKTFCTSSALDVTDAITSLTTFTLSENSVKGSLMYFMLRFKDAGGNWTYTNYKDLQIN